MKLENLIEDGGLMKDAGFNYSMDKISEILIEISQRIIVIEDKLNNFKMDKT